jgi:hypothetical protein
MAEKLAEKGWLVRVETMDAAAVMDFAVGKNSHREAIAAVMDHPAFEPGDKIISYDQLTSTEIFSYRLRPDEMRTYGKRPQGRRDGR